MDKDFQLTIQGTGGGNTGEGGEKGDQTSDGIDGGSIQTHRSIILQVKLQMDIHGSPSRWYPIAAGGLEIKMRLVGHPEFQE